MRLGLRQFRSSTLRLSAMPQLDVPDAERVRWISQIETPAADRRQGNGAMLLSLVCREADKHNVILALEPKPFDDEPMNRNALECWYTRRGFARIQDEPCVMTRRPRQ